MKEIVGSVSPVKNSFSRGKLAAEIFNQVMDILEDLESRDFLREYRTRCFILGKNILVHPSAGHRGIRARAIDIDDNGGPCSGIYGRPQYEADGHFNLGGSFHQAGISPPCLDARIHLKNRQRDSRVIESLPSLCRKIYIEITILQLLNGSTPP